MVIGKLPEIPAMGILTTETVVKPLAGTLLAFTAAVRSKPPPGNEDDVVMPAAALTELPLSARPGDITTSFRNSPLPITIPYEDDAVGGEAGKKSEELL